MTHFSFSQQHGTMLLKYSGISFIAGAVNHGVFSGERAMWTAGTGMALFVLGTWLAHRWSPSAADATQGSSLARTLVWGSLLSIGVGFFTGGLQHFADSPARSAWVVPLGFALSALAMALNDGARVLRPVLAYAVGASLLVGAGSWGAWQALEHAPAGANGGHAHNHDEGHSSTQETAPASAAPAGPVALVVTRSVAVRMDDSMRFTPDRIAVRAGETIRLVVHNAGRSTHEMVLGNAAELQAHAALMRQSPQDAHHAHGTGSMVSVEAGATRELVVRFDAPTTLQMACLVPGHYEAGMRGTLLVQAADASAADIAVPTKPTKPATHDHSSHTHGSHGDGQ